LFGELDVIHISTSHYYHILARSNVCQRGNLKEDIEAVGEKNAISRGSELIERLMELILARTEM